MQRPKTTGSVGSRRPAPRNYFSRREQYRLLVLVGLICGVLWAMNKARDPRNWYWLLDPTTESTAEPEPDPDPPGGYDTHISDRSNSSSSLSPDVFRIPAQAPPPPPEVAGDYFPGVRADYVQSIEDDWTIGRSSEYHAFYHFLKLLAETPLEELEAASKGEVGFRQLFEQRDEYRGQLVTVNGIVHRVETITPRENDYGVEKYYRLWMEPVGGPRELMSAIFLELPDSFPTDPDEVETIRPQIEFTGFFYKREAYQALGDGMGEMSLAPLVLAKSPHWVPPPPPPPPLEFELGKFMLAVGATLLVAIALACAAWYYSRRRSPQAEKYALTSRVKGEDIAKPDDEDVLPSTLEALGRLAQSEAESSSGDSEGPSLS